MGRKSKQWHEQNKAVVELEDSKEINEMPTEPIGNFPDIDDTKPAETTAQDHAAYKILSERKVGMSPVLGMPYGESLVKMQSNYEKLYEQIDLLEKGKIGTWQAAFEIVREIRKLKGEPAK